MKTENMKKKKNYNIDIIYIHDFNRNLKKKKNCD